MKKNQPIALLSYATQNDYHNDILRVFKDDYWITLSYEDIIRIGNWITTICEASLK